MDIAKYIGQFLLKNHFCYIHGLGNMELRKLPATYDNKTLQSPSYEVVVTMGGSIDDNLANFIATNEQISISKAANALRDYSIQARADLAEGKDVAIPGIGKYVETNGRIRFVTDANFSFTPAGLPTIKNSKQLEEKNAKPIHTPSYPAPHKADSVNWSRVILIIILLIILGGGAYGIYYMMNNQKEKKQEAAAAIPVPVKDTVVTQPIAADTTHVTKDSSAQATQPAATTGNDALSSYKIIIGDYTTRAKADKRLHTLTTNGNHVEMVAKDSTNFMILATVNCKAIDTVHVKDSLKALFGYKNVMLYK